jgi:hypothetical protein
VFAGRSDRGDAGGVEASGEEDMASGGAEEESERIGDGEDKDETLLPGDDWAESSLS